MSSPSNPERPRRLFLALWPGDRERQQLGRLAAHAARQQRRIADHLLHLTLVFLGPTDAERQAIYEAALADLTVPEMELVLDRYGYWPRSQILWLGCKQTPPELDELVADLQRRLHSCGFAPEARAFQAHVTLARRFPGPVPTEPPPVPVRWRVNEVALVESAPPPRLMHYQVRRRWPERR
jgi:2'-5' RNA ligase